MTNRLVSRRVNTAVKELISIQSRYVDYREQIKNCLKDYLIGLKIDGYKIDSDLWESSRTDDENLITIIDSYYGYVCKMMLDNEKPKMVARYLLIRIFS